MSDIIALNDRLNRERQEAMATGPRAVDAGYVERLAHQQSINDQEAQKQRAAEDYWQEPAANGEPPEAAELGVDIAGLSVSRGRLVRFLAWRDRMQRDLAQLESGRAKYLETLGVPTATETKLADLVEKDTSNLVDWMRGGGADARRKNARSAEHEKLTEKLANDRHQAEVARVALAQVEEEIDLLQQRLAITERRHKEFASGVLVEQAVALVEIYEQQLAALQETTHLLVGLATAADAGPAHGLRTKMVRVQDGVTFPALYIPKDGSPTDRVDAPSRLPVVRLAAEMLPELAAPWRAKVEALMADPRADIGPAD